LVLDGEEELGNLSFSELKAKLEFRSDKGHLARAYHSQFTNRRQKGRISSYSERSWNAYRLAYPECFHESRDKIAYAQFVSALPRRAMAVKIIQENNAFGMEGGQREMFKFRAGKGLGENNLEGGKNEESNLKRNKVKERNE